MLLRSSSTPVLSSLLSSFSETAHKKRYSNSEAANATTPEHVSSSILPHSKISYKQLPNLAASLHNNSSPLSPSVSEVLSGNSHITGFRRVQSEGNLEGLAASSSNCIDEFNFSIIPANKSSRRPPPHCFTLEPIPSFSFHNSSRNRKEDEEDSEEEEMNEQMVENENGIFCDSAGIENLCLKADKTTNYASGYENNNLGFEKEKDGTVEMYLARGLGIADFNFVDIGGHISGGSGGGQDYRPVAFGGEDGGDTDSQGFIMEEHHKKMLDDNPCNALCLRNYAQFLHQTKGDLQSAEDYYCRAILADPTDGEVLSQYAKLVWEVYRDKDRATGYFERAVRAAGDDSHVQAAYASFLWETDDDDDDDDEDEPALQGPKPRPMQTLFKQGITA